MGVVGTADRGIPVDRLLTQAMAKSRMTAGELAAAADTSRSAVHDYRRGAVSPTVRTLDRLLAACGLQARVLLEPLMADLDERVDVLEGPLPAFEEDNWRPLIASLNDEPGARDGRIGTRAPRRGPVTWAVDGASALVLHGLAAEPKGLEAQDIVVVLDEALRFWMWGVNLRGEHPEDGLVMDWLDADEDRMVQALAGVRHCVLGFVRIRVVTRAGATVSIAVPWHDQPVPVVTVDEVERTNPVYAEVLARWRSRRELS